MFVSIYGAATGNCSDLHVTRRHLCQQQHRCQDRSQDDATPLHGSFLAKGRTEGVLRDMPLKIVLNDNAGIIGAARFTLVQKAFSSNRKTVA
jgi:hypothetical protein